MSESIRALNFDELYQSTAASLLLPVCENECLPIGILLLVSILTCSSSWAWHFALSSQILSQLVHPPRCY